MFKITGLNHVGIAVSNLDDAISTFKTKLGLEVVNIVESKSQGLKMGIVKTENCIIELMEPIDPKGTVAKFLERQGRNALHHIAFSVDSDLEKVAEDMKAVGVEMIYPYPSIGVLGHPVNFCHPKFTSNVLIELSDVDHDKRQPQMK